jgi:hypothetical protein
MNGDFFEAIVQLLEAYDHLSTAEAESHCRAAHSLFEASIPFLERLAVTVPPHKNDFLSGHFHTGWSVGQLLYLLGVAGFELRGGTFLQEGYNVRALVRRPQQELEPMNA